MRIRKMALLLVCADLFFILPPASAQLEKHKGPSEKLDLRVDTCKDLIPVDLIKLQQATSPQDNGGRAIFLPIVAGYAINKGVQVLQKMISDRQNRYIAQYNFA